MSLRIRNPHSVLAALENRPEGVLEIRISGEKDEPGNQTWTRVLQKAKENRIKVTRVSSSLKMTSKNEDGGRSSEIEAIIEPKPSISAEELFSPAKHAEGVGLWLALDSLQDPQNVGAIFRAAAFFGVQGIMLTQERSAPMSSVVYDVSSGGVEYIPYTLQTNLQRGFEVAKDFGLWILGTSEHANDSISSIQRDRHWLLVLGNEEKGMRRLTEESCDVLCKIPFHDKAKVTSLNVSVASGIFISYLSGKLQNR